jgi:ribonuclease HII
MVLEKCYSLNLETIEIGVDEVGRGPMFGRVYAAAVILPKDDNFKYELMKDSKKFTSKKKIIDVASYIKDNCISYGIGYEEHTIIDKINIKNAAHNAMEKAIKKIINYDDNNSLILVDGSNFKLITYMDNDNGIIKEIPTVCIEGGDNKYCSIAAASILAKVERDKYIEELCIENPDLIEKYDLLKNKGYGTKKHLAGIQQYGITQWHRQTFGICKNY